VGGKSDDSSQCTLLLKLFLQLLSSLSSRRPLHSSEISRERESETPSNLIIFRVRCEGKFTFPIRSEKSSSCLFSSFQAYVLSINFPHFITIT
jgi:hypothetical protein